jgi:hypothetical protein
MLGKHAKTLRRQSQTFSLYPVRSGREERIAFIIDDDFEATHPGEVAVGQRPLVFPHPHTSLMIVAA